MKVLDATLVNYGSFVGEHVFSFADRSILLVLGHNLDEPNANSNGAGKSTLADALEWALFGVNPRGDVADAVISVGQDFCRVTARVVDDDGAVHTVERRRGKGQGFRTWVGAVETTRLDTSATQEALEVVLGLDREIWRSAVYFSQREGIRFAEATDAVRKDILTRILGLGEIDEALERATAAHRQAETEHVASESRLVSLLASREQIARDREQAHAQAVGHATKRQAALQALAQALSAQQHAQAQWSAYSQGLPPLQPLDVPEPPGLSQGLSDEREALAQASAARHEVQGLERALAKAQATALVCPTCQRPHPDAPALRDRLVAETLQSLTTARLAFTAADERARTVSAWVTEARAGWERAKRSAAQAYTEAAREHERARAALMAAGTECARLVSEQHRLASEVNPYEARAQELTARMDAADDEIERLRESLVDLGTRVHRLAFWKTAFGPKGIKSFVLDERLADLTQEANRWLSLLSGGRMWVRFETQRSVGKGKAARLTESFSIRVFKYEADGTTTTERAFASWSGGEQRRVSLAIDFALARLVARRARKSYDILILDEVFGKSLDTEGKEAVARMLRELAREKSTIMVVDHDLGFQHSFQTSVTVVKQNGRSRITEAVTGVEQKT